MPELLSVPMALALPPHYFDGKLFVLPTEGFYALGCRGDEPASCRKIMDTKNRKPTHPLLLLVDSLRMMRDFGAMIDDGHDRLLRAIIPAPLTVIFTVKPETTARYLGAKNGKIGFRVPSNEDTLKLIAHIGCPIVGTSANISGRPPARRTNRLSGELLENVDTIIDGGTLAGGLPSTVIEFCDGRFWVVRHGAYNTGILERYGYRMSNFSN